MSGFLGYKPKVLGMKNWNICLNSTWWEPTPWGEGAWDGCSRQPLPVWTEKRRFAARPDWQGLPTAPNLGGAEGGLQGAIIGVAFVVCALMKSTPLGVGGGLAGAMAAASAIAPALGHQARREL